MLKKCGANQRAQKNWKIKGCSGVPGSIQEIKWKTQKGYFSLCFLIINPKIHCKYLSCWFHCLPLGTDAKIAINHYGHLAVAQAITVWGSLAFSMKNLLLNSSLGFAGVFESFDFLVCFGLWLCDTGQNCSLGFQHSGHACRSVSATVWAIRCSRDLCQFMAIPHIGFNSF